MQDLSKVVFGSDPISALVPTSQEGGNMRASNELAMTAPGSTPVDVMQPAGEYFHNDPTVSTSNASVITPASDGKPQASSQASGYSPPPPAWKATGTPNVVRQPMTTRNSRDM
jgi:hypothetical protein